MSQKLSDTLSRLYQPPKDGVRQVLALSRKDAERLPRLQSMAVISITSPDRQPANLDGFDHLLRLHFEDIDFLNPRLSKKAQKKIIHAFTSEQAQAIRSFVDAMPNEVASVVVHCEGGYSRSCAVALAIHCLYGYHAETNFLAQANPSVFQVMMMD